MRDDPDREQAGRIFSTLYELSKDQKFAVKQVAVQVSWAGFGSEMTDAFEEAGLKSAGSVDRRRLGWWFKHHEGWVAGGYKLIRVDRESIQPTFQIERKFTKRKKYATKWSRYYEAQLCRLAL